MTTREENSAGYEAMREELEAKYYLKWVVFRHNEFQSVHDELSQAAAECRRRFKDNRFLIIRVGIPPCDANGVRKMPNVRRIGQ